MTSFKTSSNVDGLLVVEHNEAGFQEFVGCASVVKLPCGGSSQKYKLKLFLYRWKVSEICYC